MMNQASGLPLGLAAAQMRNLMGGTQGHAPLGFGDYEVPGLGGTGWQGSNQWALQAGGQGGGKEPQQQ